MRSLLKFERYQLLRNRVFLLVAAGMAVTGWFSGNMYIEEVIGPDGGVALKDILNAMVFDSTAPLILVCCLLAMFLGQEFSWRTIGLEVSAGHPRSRIFASKVVTYLAVFNVIAFAYPVFGCLHLSARFGVGDADVFLWHLARAAVFSFLENSALFMIPMVLCFLIRSTSRAVAATALTVFVLALYLAYGTLWGLPTGFLPTQQIRAAVRSASFGSPAGVIVAFCWTAALLGIGWRLFRRCELK